MLFPLAGGRYHYQILGFSLEIQPPADGSGWHKKSTHGFQQMNAFIDDIKRIQDGDQEAIRELLLSESARLKSFIQSRLGAKHQGVVDADDVLQETFIAIYREIGTASFENEEAFRSWCFRLAEHRLVDILRAQNRKKRGGEMQRVAVDRNTETGKAFHELSAKATTPSVKLAKLEKREEVDDAINQLPTLQRKATRLKYFEGRKNGSIALILGKTTQAVEGLLKRAKKRLLALLTFGRHS